MQYLGTQERRRHPGGFADSRICFSAVTGPHISLTDGYTHRRSATMLNLQRNDPAACSVHKLGAVLKSSLAGCARIQQRRPFYGKQKPHSYGPASLSIELWTRQTIERKIVFLFYPSLPLTLQTICIVMQRQVEWRATGKTSFKKAQHISRLLSNLIHVCMQSDEGV